jgi:two-component system chemotaxis response regulator CheY
MATILVIDDDAQVRAALRRILERAGYTVVTAADGQAGMRLHRERPADLIITDLFMPDQDGIETIRQLRREGPAVPILAVSGGDQTGAMDLREGAALLGASRTLGKPFELAQLLAAVGELLEEASPGG